jgi:hypothetical protein
LKLLVDVAPLNHTPISGVTLAVWKARTQRRTSTGKAIGRVWRRGVAWGAKRAHALKVVNNPEEATTVAFIALAIWVAFTVFRA